MGSHGVWGQETDPEQSAGIGVPAKGETDTMNTRITPEQRPKRSLVLRSMVAALVATITLGAVALPAMAADTQMLDTQSAEPDEPPSTYTGPFVDDEGSVHEQDIAAVWLAGITRGCAEWKFCPTDKVTRGEMAAFMVRGFGISTEQTQNVFVDLDNSPFVEEVAAIAAADITRGCDRRRFCPEDNLTRGEMAAFLRRALGLQPASKDWFRDDNGSIFEGDINSIAEAGLTSGCGEGRYCPDRYITRQELASMLQRALGLPYPAPSELPDIPQDVIDEWEAKNNWPTGPDPEGWRPLVEKYFKPQDVQRAIDVIRCESGGYQYAANPTSSARGLFQHMGKFWKERSAAAGIPGADIFDPEAQMIVAAWLVYEQGGWSRHWYPSQHCWG